MNADEKMSAYKLLLNILDDSNENHTEDDNTFRTDTKQQISKRDSEYTYLLTHFVRITKIRNILKEFFKWSFYLLVIGTIFVLTLIVYKLFNKYMKSANIEQILNSMPLLITSMVGFVSTIITIPVTITKYLFSTEEDHNITQIILHTQEHDMNGRQWTMDFKKIIENFDKKQENNFDIPTSIKDA